LSLAHTVGQSDRSLLQKTSIFVNSIAELVKTLVMRESGILDIINSIAVFQLLFFTLFLFIKGNKIPSTFFLKINLIFQTLSYINYLYFINGYQVLKPLLIFSIPSVYIWAPTFYFYIRSRLYLKFVPSLKLFIHGIPALLVLIYLLWVLIKTGLINEERVSFNNLFYISYKVQLLIYNVYTLFIIYKYQYELTFQTSASAKRKLNWLLLITYGITLNSVAGFILNSLSEYKSMNWEYFFFLIFLNIFFFKAIIQPDQFLGIDEKKLLSVNLDKDKSVNYFRRIEEIINSNRLYLDPDLSLHNVAQAVKLSDRIVSQTIKQNVGLSLTDYINIKRIDYARGVLRSTTKSEKNVLEILYEAGFNSKSVFNTQFKKHTGQSPTDFRNMNKSNI